MGSISHSFLTYASDILAETNEGLSGSQIVKFFNSKSVDYSVDIPHDRAPLSMATNKRTAFLENLICFSPEQQFQILSELTEDDRLKDIENVKKLRQKLHGNYSDFSSVPTAADSEQVQKAQHFLEQYRDAYNSFNSALEKYKNKVYERNTLDDLRLSLELLLRHVLKNGKSLENQLPELGTYQKAKGISPEVTNMFSKLLDMYSKYQNTYVKHNDNVNDKEIDFMINLTTAFMLFLVSQA
jgi:hypothetical protein